MCVFRFIFIIYFFLVFLFLICVKNRVRFKSKKNIWCLRFLWKFLKLYLDVEFFSLKNKYNIYLFNNYNGSINGRVLFGKYVLVICKFFFLFYIVLFCCNVSLFIVISKYFFFLFYKVLFCCNLSLLIFF